MKKHNASGASLTSQDKEAQHLTQMQTFVKYLREHVATCSMASHATGIPQKNLTRYKRTQEKAGQLWEVCKRNCQLTGFKANWLTTDPAKAPKQSQAQLKLFALTIITTKNKTGLQALKELFLKDRMLKHPNIKPSYIPIPVYNDTSANGLTRAIIDFINLSGWQAERVNSTGMPKTSFGGTTWIKGNGQKGTADIHATIQGRSVKIEIKIGPDKQSQHQKEYQENIEKSGGLYFIATGFQQFFDWYNSTFNY